MVGLPWETMELCLGYDIAAIRFPQAGSPGDEARLTQSTEEVIAVFGQESSLLFRGRGNILTVD